MDNLKQLKNQIKGLFPKANEKGITAIAKILDQCCCEFDPCNISGGPGIHSSPIELQDAFGVQLGFIHTTSIGN